MFQQKLINYVNLAELQSEKYKCQHESRRYGNIRHSQKGKSVGRPLSSPIHTTSTTSTPVNFSDMKIPAREIRSSCFWGLTKDFPGPFQSGLRIPTFCYVVRQNCTYSYGDKINMGQHDRFLNMILLVKVGETLCRMSSHEVQHILGT